MQRSTSRTGVACASLAAICAFLATRDAAASQKAHASRVDDLARAHDNFAAAQLDFDRPAVGLDKFILGHAPLPPSASIFAETPL